MVSLAEVEKVKGEVAAMPVKYEETPTAAKASFLLHTTLENRFQPR
jgi:hypothetical protein